MPETGSQSVRAYVGMGSNLDDRAGNLLLGVRGMLSAGLRVLRLSSVYETEPVGVSDVQPAYLNTVAELGPPLPPPEEMLARLLEIEHALGRRRTHVNAARTLDLDLLLYDVAHVVSPLITLPHPRMHLRRFVLEPLCELAPATRHPVLNKTCAELLAAVSDRSRVKLWSPRERRKDEVNADEKLV
jgi:2-amino-4-hydroxy-6-hydroxymethyldihydropteridine diphosphokinase